MKKKIYTKPAMEVAEYEMIIITGASQVTSISGGTFDKAPMSDENYSGPIRANNRGGIWDED